MHKMLIKIIEQKKKDLVFQRKINFKSAILKGERMTIIGELKFASPLEGVICSVDSLLEKAMNYVACGVDAISIITENRFFKGDISFIPLVKQAVDIPILQKDFVIDKSQIYQAKVIGADAILLIARIVDEKTLKEFVILANKLGIEPVVEIANDQDLKKAISTKTEIIAVNARDLDTFKIDVLKAVKLMKKIPEKFIRLGFSGIKSSKEIKLYKMAGAKGVLVGTSLMRAKNIEEFVKELKAYDS